MRSYTALLKHTQSPLQLPGLIYAECLSVGGETHSRRAGCNFPQVPCLCMKPYFNCALYIQ